MRFGMFAGSKNSSKGVLFMALSCGLWHRLKTGSESDRPSLSGFEDEDDADKDGEKDWTIFVMNESLDEKEPSPAARAQSR